MTTTTDQTTTTTDEATQDDGFSLDVRSFHEYLADVTRTDVLLMHKLADYVREFAAEHGVDLPEKLTPRFKVENGQRVGIGPDVRTTTAAADVIESPVIAAVAVLRAMVESACAQGDEHTVLAEDDGEIVLAVDNDDELVCLEGDMRIDKYAFSPKEAREFAAALLVHAARVEDGAR